MELFYGARKKKRLFVWGHRGAPALAVENTLESFQKAFEHEVDGVEFDVQFTRDGIPFVFHDDDLKRMAQIDRRPADMLWNELRCVEIEDSSRPHLPRAGIPRLDDVLQIIPQDRFLNLELKDVGELKTSDLRRIVGLLNESGLTPRTILSSFQHSYLLNAKALEPNLALAALWVNIPPQALLSETYRALTDVMHIPFALTSASDMLQWKNSKSSEVGVWGVKSTEDVAACLARGVDAVFVDNPQWARLNFDPA